MSGVPPPGGVPVTRDGILDGVGQLWGSLRGGLMQLHQLTRTVAARGGGGRTTAPRILPTGPPPPDLDLGPLYDAGAVYALGLAQDRDSLGSMTPLSAATYPGTGQLELMVNADADWEDSARVAVLCARRLVCKYGLRNLWMPDLDLYLATPHAFINQCSGSGGASVAMAVLSAAVIEGEPTRNWAVTGGLSLDGAVCGVGGIREKAIAAAHGGMTGLVVPSESMWQLTSAQWPARRDGSKPSEETVRRWEEAKAKLLFKAVSTLDELAAFYFPNMPAYAATAAAAAAAATAATESRSSSKGRKRPRGKNPAGQAAGPVEPPLPQGVDVGPVSVVRVPLWEWHGSGTVEACLVRGAKQPAVTGGPRLCAAHDLKLAMQLVGSHIDILDSMTAARSKQGGLVYDPRKPGDFMPHVHIFPPSNPIPGFCLLPMVVALASLITGRQPRPRSAVLAFCTVDGCLIPVGSGLELGVKAAKEQGFDRLYVSGQSVERARQLAGDGLLIRGVEHVRDLFLREADGLWMRRV